VLESGEEVGVGNVGEWKHDVPFSNNCGREFHNLHVLFFSAFISSVHFECYKVQKFER